MITVVQNNIEQGAVNFQVAVVLDKAEFAELIHEKADARTRGELDRFLKRSNLLILQSR